jgi:hypothetical protein
VLGNVQDRVLRFAYAKQAGERLELPPELLLPSGSPSAARARHAAPARAAPPHASAAVETVVTPGAKQEERAIRLLLSGSAASWPESGVFWDAGWREVFEAARKVRDEGLPLGSDSFYSRLQAVLVGKTVAVDRLARVLLEDAAGASEGELEHALGRLNRRNLQRLQRDLMRELRDAQERGDRDRLESLLIEKEKLSREYHLR